MQRITLGQLLRRATVGAAVAALGLGAAACSDDSGPSTPQSFDQIQRLGNPLISEVLLMQGAATPRTAPSVRRTTPPWSAPEILGFITGSGQRGRPVGRLRQHPGQRAAARRAGGTDRQGSRSGAGWLTWLPLAPFANGYGGGKLTDDVVDLALLAVFGDPFGADPDGAAGKEALTTDNVASDSPISGAFPYLGAPN